MDPIKDGLLDALAALPTREHRIPFVSTVTGAPLPGHRLTASYWWRNVRKPVLFDQAVRALLEQGPAVFLEIGPHSVLTSYLRRDRGTSVPRPGVVAVCRRHEDGPDAVRAAAAAAVALGVRTTPGHFPEPGRVTTLPAYPWQRERCWRGSPQDWEVLVGDRALAHPLLGQPLPIAQPAWCQEVDTGRLPWLADHRVGKVVVMPVMAFAEGAAAAGRRHFDAPVELTDLHVVQALTLMHGTDTRDLQMQTTLSPEDGIVRIASRPDAGSPWQLHVRGRARRLLAPVPGPLDLDAVRARLPEEETSPEEFYSYLSAVGLDYGPAFRVVTGGRADEDEALVGYRLPVSPDGFHAHPVILDGALQSAAALLGRAGHYQTFLPAALGAVRVWRPLDTQGYLYVRSVRITGHDAEFDILITDRAGAVAAELRACRMRRTDALAASAAGQTSVVLRSATLPGTVRPAELPAPRQVAEATATARAGLTDDRLPGLLRRLRESTAHWSAHAFTRLLPGRTRFGPADLHAAHLPDQYGQQVVQLARIAVDHGLLAAVDEAGGGGWEHRTESAAHQRARALLADYPDMAALLAVHQRCGRRLAAVLGGGQDPRELFTAEGDRHLWERFHSSTLSPALRRNARLLLGRILADRPAGAPLRVLEIGAGAGDLSAELLPLLPAELTEYTVTAPDADGFPRARARLEAYDFVDYRVLDLDDEASGPDDPAGAYDLVITSGAPHGDAVAAAHRIGRMLAEGGLLLALDRGPLPHAVLFQGLFDAPGAARPYDAGALRSALRDAGFTDITPCGPAAAAGQVLLARPPVAGGSPARADGTAAGRADLPGQWLLLSEDAANPLPAALADALARAGAQHVTTAAAADPESWEPPLSGAVPAHCVLFLDDHGARDAAALTRQAVRRAQTVRAVARALSAGARETAPALWLVTRPTGALPFPERPQDPAAAAVWGTTRTLANEHPNLSVRRISLESGPDTAADADRLLGEFRHAATAVQGPAEDEVVLTPRGRFVARLTDRHPAAGSPADGDESYGLELRSQGLRSRTAWAARPRPACGPGELLLRVHAAALNYRDVMLATGLLPPDAEVPLPEGPALGLECAGEVTAVGSEVTGYAPGDRVYAVAPGSLASHVRVRPESVGRVPDGMSYAQAATLPVVFLTVHYALDRLARLRPGETLLVHGGAGGVGLAALQYAHRLGARVIATAGTPVKRDLLRALGVDHVCDSRTLHFAEQVRDVTGGRGVDVVLNSLSGEAITRSLEALAPGGRFVELGKRDIYANQPLLLRPLRNNLSFHALDVNQLTVHAPAELAAAFREVGQRVAEGVYRPLPHEPYPAGEVHEAFRTLQHSRHLGKVVISLAEPPALERPVPPPAPAADATYLVTGGTSGFGAATARHLAARGVRHLALVSRRGPLAPGAAELVRELAALGATAHLHAADVTDPAALGEVFAQARAQGRPVGGVVHAAMHLDDAPLAELDADRFHAVLAPKMQGALVLDELTREHGVDHFVAYSSISALIGNPTQAPYVAGNLFQEALVRARRDRGRPAWPWPGAASTRPVTSSGRG
ncbi:Type I polyketide synthase OS=Streptomyces fumanus OX=67302 GN=wcbR PE=4 SV=1 [Streptomyces fumanus]